MARLDSNPAALDAQTIAVLGKSYVRMLLQRDGVEVAEPACDRGIDLIAYLDQHTKQLYAQPIQVKSSLQFRWTHHVKYRAFPGLILAHVMHLEDQTNTRVYATNYSENHAIAKKLKYLERPLWLDSPDGQKARMDTVPGCTSRA